MENIFELVDKKLKKLREAEAKQSKTNDKDAINTSDEKVLGKLLDKLPILTSRLQNIDQPIELDGLFIEILTETGLKNMSKQIIMNSLKTALEKLSPNNPTYSSPKTLTKKK